MCCGITSSIQLLEACHTPPVLLLPKLHQNNSILYQLHSYFLHPNMISMFKIQVEPYSGCMSQSPSLPFTYLFMLTDYVIIHQQKDQHRRTKIHHLTARGKLIFTTKLVKKYTIASLPVRTLE